MKGTRMMLNFKEVLKDSLIDLLNPKIKKGMSFKKNIDKYGRIAYYSNNELYKIVFYWYIEDDAYYGERRFRPVGENYIGLHKSFKRYHAYKTVGKDIESNKYIFGDKLYKNSVSFGSLNEAKRACKDHCLKELSYLYE